MPMPIITPITVYDSTTNAAPSSLAAALLAANSGIVLTGPVLLNASGNGAVNFYDGSLTGLGIGAGLLLTSGTTPGTSNTVGWFGQDNTNWSGVVDPVTGLPQNFFNGNAQIDAIVNTVFQTQSFDATTLKFDFTVADPTATSISFDVVFGSEEYPEWVDLFVDCAVVIVNGVNYAYFNHDPKSPLSVIGSNLANGYFQDNAGNVLPIEYDGVSHVLKIIAPIVNGQTNTIEIGIADTGDHIYDSGIFIANLSAGNTPGSGVVITPDVPTTTGDDIVSGSIKDELIDLQAGNDIAYAGGGDDIVVAGAGNDSVYGGTGEDVIEGDAGDDYLDGGEGFANKLIYAGTHDQYNLVALGNGVYTVSSTQEGVDTLKNFQQAQFSDGLFDITGTGFSAHSTGILTPVNTPGSVVIGGATVAGNTLTALVVDANGLGANTIIDYVWSTSTDNQNWNVVVGATSKTYQLSSADAGKYVSVTASYQDADNFAEQVSGSVQIAKPTVGVFINPMVLDAPAGASVKDPITTMLVQAISLGYTVNEAAHLIKLGLGVNADINLGTYDAYAILSNPSTASDATALAFMKIEAQVAMTASMSDPTGLQITLAALNAGSAASPVPLNLKLAADLIVAGLDSTNTKNFDIAQNLNKDMADANSFATVKSVWKDWAGQVDNVKSYQDHLDLISVHINQAPVGAAPYVLEDAQQDTAYTIYESDLLASYSDPENPSNPAVLFVTQINIDQGGALQNNLDGTWTFTPDASYVGPVELSYTVADVDGAQVSASTMFVVQSTPITPPSTTITGTIDNDILGGTLDNDTIQGLGGDDLLIGDMGNDTIDGGAGSDAAAYTGDMVDYLITYSGDGTWTIADQIADRDGTDILSNVELAEFADQTYAISQVAPAFVDPSHTDTAVAGYTFTYSENSADTAVLGTVMALDTDAADTVTYSIVTNIYDAADVNQLNPFYAINANGDVSLTAAGVLAFTNDYELSSNSHLIVVRASDGVFNTDIDVNIIEANINDNAPQGSVTITGSAIQDQTLTVSDNLTDADGLGVITYQWYANGVAINNATGATYKLTQTEVGKTITAIASYVDGSGAAESVTSNMTSAVIAANVNLVGTVGIDTLTGGTGNDTLTGAGAVDRLNGAGGSDIYIMTASADHTAAEIADTGTGLADVDEVRFTLATASATAASNILTLYAGDTGLERAVISDANGITTGTAALSINAALVANAITLVGNAGANTLTGTTSNDTLIGGLGVDTLVGGLGNDTFVVNLTTAAALEDTITELAAAGTDTVQLAGTYSGAVATLTLAANLENIDASAIATSLLNLTGNTVANVITGNDAANVITGAAGADTLNGGNGSDIYSVTVLADYAAGETINDTGTGVGDVDELRVALAATGTFTVLASTTGIERIAIGTGTAATAVATATTAINVNAAALSNAVTMVGNAGSNILTGGAGNDSLDGGAGTDTLDGGLGNDTLTGGIAIDRFNVTAGTDTITDLGNGGADVMVVSAGATANATINTSWTAAATSVNSGVANIMTNGLVTNLAAVITGNGFNVTNIGAATTLTGSGLADSITGGTGNDTITAGAGNDTIIGGDGVDVITAGAGSDSINGGNGSDIYSVTVLADYVAGETINDTGTGLTDVDELRVALAAAGTFTVLASTTGIERIAIGTGTAATAVATATTAINVNAAALSNAVMMVGNAGANALTGSASNDTLTGGTGIDTFNVTAGIDTITDLGNGGAEVLTVTSGATANATVTAAWTATVATRNTGGTANITTNALAVNLGAVTGGTAGFNVTNIGAATTLTGSAQSDSLTGGIGNDTLVGGAGNDSIIGGLGNDQITAGAGNDTVDGGEGSDIYFVALAADQPTTDVIADTGLTGTDELRFTTTVASTLTLGSSITGIETIVIGTGTAVAAVTSGATNNNVDASALTTAVSMTGNGGANSLVGGAGADTILGGAGNDTLAGGVGNDTLTGGAGADTFNVTAGTDTVTDLGGATTTADVLTITSGATANATVTAAWTATVATTNTGGTANITTSALAVNLGTVTGGTAGFNVTNIGAATTLTGSAQNDSLTGGTGNDTITAGAGNDTLIGGLGNDSLTGGAGSDRFILNTTPNATTNRDTIADFVTATDSIWLDKAIYTALSTNTLNTAITSAQYLSGAGVVAATTVDQHLLYNTTTGILYYDADGSAAGQAAVQIALIGATTHPTLAAGDIFVY
jgi:Ca2+-binding RTX toxin-like protein